MEKKEIKRKLQDIKWFVSLGDKRGADIYPDYDKLANFILEELDKAREEGYEKGLEDLHSSDTYQEAICDYGEWSQEGMDEGFEEAKKDLLSKLKQ